MIIDLNNIYGFNTLKYTLWILSKKKQVYLVGIFYHVYAHVDCYIIAKMFEEEVNNSLLKGKLDTQLVKKWSNQFSSAIVNCFGAKKPFYKNHIQQKWFLEYMGLGYY